ncbi:MAG: hypothetical protein CL908_13830 [Deltaproteobacteria bacterium]|nr:hypothetical protein [Deltaproteobacteria bacterium]
MTCRDGLTRFVGRSDPATKARSSGGAILFLSLVLVLGLSGCDAEPQRGPSVETRIDSSAAAERIAAARSVGIGEAYQQALDEADPFLQHMLFAAVYGRVDASNFAEFREVFERKLDRRSADESRVFGNLWAKIDSQAALRGVMTWTNPRARKFASEEVMSVWAQQPNAAEVLQAFRDLAGELPSGVLQQGQYSLAEALGRHLQLEALLSLLLGVDDVEHRTRLATASLIEMTRAERDAFVRWVEQLRGDDSVPIELRYELVMQVIRLQVTRDLDEALAWYPTIASEEYAGDALTIIAQKWGRDDPVAAMEFMRQRPESENPGSAKRAAAYLWLNQDPGMARTELRKAVEEDPTMSSVIFPLVQFMMVNELEEAMELAQRVPKLEEREAVLKQGLMRWARRDPAGLDGYLARYDVSDSVQRSIRAARSLKESRRENPGTQ